MYSTVTRLEKDVRILKIACALLGVALVLLLYVR